METPPGIDQEIRELASKLEAKKRELRGSGIERHEQDIFRDVVREHAAAGESAPPVPLPYSSSQSQPSTTSVPPEKQHQLDAFVEHAFTKGIAAAIREARRTGDPYLLDLLHDRLADEYYEKLVAARRVDVQ